MFCTYVGDLTETNDLADILVNTEEHSGSVGSPGLKLLQGSIQCLQQQKKTSLSLGGSHLAFHMACVEDCHYSE